MLRNYLLNNLWCLVPRIPTANKNEKGDDVDPIKPVYVGEFPQVVRDEQTKLLQKHIPGLYTRIKLSSIVIF